MKQIKKNGLLWGIVGTIALLVIVAVVVRTPKTCHHVEVIDAGKEATCFEPGLTDGVHCSICGEVLKEQKIIPALGHTTNAGICSRCGESIGVWTTRNYVDEFNEPTYMRYVTTTSKLTGTFSNTAATNEKLTADIIVDSINVSFILYEYGKYQVKSNLDSSYHITIKYGTSKRNVIGKLNSDRIEIYGKQDIADSMEALRSGETVSFYIENSEYTTTQYRFSVDSSNFSIEYDKNILVYLNEYIYAKEHGRHFNFIPDKVNVEHIMPASGHNIDAIRTDAGMSKEEFEDMVNLLGNKILLEEDINKCVGRDWFKTKKGTLVQNKKGYMGSDFGIATALSLYPSDTWGKEDIDAANQKAAERICNFIFNEPHKSKE